MQIISTINMAFKALNANKGRTSLTVLGMVIGIASVMIVYSAGAGFDNLISGQIESFGGSDFFETEIKVPSTKKGGSSETQSATNLAQGVQVTTLSLEDMDDITALPNVIDSYAGIMDQEVISYGNEIKRGMIMGVSASYIELDQSEIETGVFFSNTEDKSLTQVAVLGYKIKDKLFGESDPIGKSIKVRKTKFRIIGVMKERGGVMGFDFDDLVYVPIRTLQKKVMGINHVQYMMHKVADVSIIDETAEEARYILRENHDLQQLDPEQVRQGFSDTGKDDFRVVTMQESMDIMDTVTGAITLLLLAIVAISLVVGGVGILNVMYVIVTERTAEIGLRKAVGATYNSIMFQFLIESVIITVLGGVIGVIIGLLLSLGIAFAARSYGLEWEFVVPFKAFAVALGFSGFFGIAFGLFPARKAAKLDPIEALRNE